MRLIIKSPEYYGVPPNYINREIASEDEEKRILEVLLKYDENSEVYHKETSGREFLRGNVKERYSHLKKEIQKRLSQR